MPRFLLKSIILVLVFALTISDMAKAKTPNEKKIDIILNSKDKQKRHEVIREIDGRIDDEQLVSALFKAGKTDKSYRVRTLSLSKLQNHLGLVALDIRKTVPNSFEAQEKIDENREKCRAELRPLFSDTYIFNCEYPSEVKTLAVDFFRSSDKPKDFKLLLEELYRICSLSIEERKMLESPRRGSHRGDTFLGQLVGVLASSRGKQFKTGNIVYVKNIEGKFIPLLEDELRYAENDYRLSLLIILGKISTHTSYDPERKGRFKFYTLDSQRLIEIEDGLAETHSRYLQRELLRVLNAYNYVLIKEKAIEIKEEFARRAESNTKE